MSQLAAEGKLMTEQLRSYNYHEHASAATSRGPRHTSACAANRTQHLTVSHQPTLCTLVGIGSGQRQLIAVTCIAEHA